jgi:hypothetical protein
MTCEFFVLDGVPLLRKELSPIEFFRENNEIFHILNHSLSCSESCMDKACNEMKNAILHRIEHSRTEDNSDQTVCLSKCLRIIFIHIQMLLTTFTLFTL